MKHFGVNVSIYVKLDWRPSKLARGRLVWLKATGRGDDKIAPLVCVLFFINGLPINDRLLLCTLQDFLFSHPKDRAYSKIHRLHLTTLEKQSSFVTNSTYLHSCSRKYYYCYQINLSWIDWILAHCGAVLDHPC